MTECRSPELQDLLPDYIADVLDEVTTARIAAHLGACAACTDDLAVLQLVRRVRPRVAVPDISRIVAALPPSPATISSNVAPVFAGPRLVRDVASAASTKSASPSLPPSMHSTRKRGAVFGLSIWRLAATLAVVVAGGASVLVARRGVTGVNDPSAVLIADSARDIAAGVAPELAETVAVNVTARSAAVSVSYGDLGDYSEDELHNMLDRLDKWDGATSTEPLPGVPLLLASGGSTP